MSTTPTNHIKQRTGAGTNGSTMLLHVNLPKDLVNAVRNLARSERRTITSQVALLLEQSLEKHEAI